MPELPEVETVRRDLARAFLGHDLERIVVTGRRTVRRHPPELLGALDGRTLTATGRHGKYLLLEWDDGQVLVVHLRMSGQLLAAHADDSLVPHTHAVMTFNGADELRFVDPRTFGEFFLATPGAGKGKEAGAGGANVIVASRPAELDHLGPDALEVDVAHFRAALAGRRAPLKSLLVDQSVVAGIGNIYADEILLRRPRSAGAPRRFAQAGGAREAHRVDAIDPPVGDSGPRFVAGRRAVPGSAGCAWTFPVGAQGLRPLRPKVLQMWA